MNFTRIKTYHSEFSLLTCIIALTTCFLTTHTDANDLDIRLNNDAVHTNFTLDSSRAKAKFGLGYFYKDDKYSTNIVNATLHAKGRTAINNMPTSVSVGFEGNFFKLDNFKGSAAGIGGSARVNIPSVPGLSVESDLHYAPKVLSFGDSNEFRRFRLQSNYRIIENADIAIGYRYINVGSEQSNDNTTIESSIYLGLQLEL